MDMLDEALFSFRDNTGQGVDAIGPRFVKWLPRRARQELLELLTQAERVGSWPWQVLMVLEVLLPKPQGGTRAVGLLPFVARVWLRMRKFTTTRRWSAEQARAYDDAIAGSSALRSAMVQ